MRRVAVLGSGVVGQVLADGLVKHGYEVTRGTRDPSKLKEWKKGKVGTFEEAARSCEAVVLAVKGTAAESAVRMCGPENLAGKTVMDATNPIADEPPVNGVLKFFTRLDDSLMERLQRLAQKANFVKCFSCVGNAFMVNPDFGGVKPTMFICGNNAKAKDEAKEVLKKFGWEWEDLGGVEAARAIEPLCILWCIPGLQRNEWGHAFKLLKK